MLNPGHPTFTRWLDTLSKNAAFQSWIRSLKSGPIKCLGIAEPGKAFFLALMTHFIRSPLIVHCSSPKQMESLHADCTALLPLFDQENGSPSLHAHLIPELESIRSPELQLPDLEAFADTLRTLRSLQNPSQCALVFSTTEALQQSFPSVEKLNLQTRKIEVGQILEMDALVETLLESGYEEEAQTTARGHYSKRGGLLDFFPIQSEHPIRLEFMGNQIDSIRIFDISTQASVTPVHSIEYLGVKDLKFEDDTSGRLSDYLPAKPMYWREFTDPNQAPEWDPMETSSPHGSLEWNLYPHEFLSTSPLESILWEHRQKLLFRNWKEWIEQGWTVIVCSNNEGEEHRLREMTPPELVQKTDWKRLSLVRGFTWPDLKLVVLSDSEIFGRYQSVRMRKAQHKLARAMARREAMDFSQFEAGDFVVHVQHGIARFEGVTQVNTGDTLQEVLTLKYRGDALLHVPIEQAHLVGKYVGVGKFHPDLDELGGSRWEKTTKQAYQAIHDYAAQLLKIDAERKLLRGFKCQSDNAWQHEFEEAFLYDETPDQLLAIEDTKHDMESEKPMDRLICGDVGFGKTEVAIRAAFKAVMNGKQVALLAPTTVLAQQHERTFRERMADYPVQIDWISRFRTKGEIRKCLQATQEGRVDILIGTHRLLQPDVNFKNLGLVVVDEEQRFGVKHKERFKETFKFIDILTLSATPIPRTLYMSLVGARDISTIETPPPNRLPVETLIAAYDERLIRNAMERELHRGGQVFYLHNRVASIQDVCNRLKNLVPKARIEFAHGQMDEDDLEEIMMRFVQGETDVLVATTIIESGLDIPRANTIIIDRADRFGLADLYQLRGRVGRGQTKAFAYLLLPRHLMIEADAKKRVTAIKQYSHLGAGFKIAMRDLEIRGAGNMLGTEQSGHATAIGFELYCQLLKETLSRMKGEKVKPRTQTRIRIDFLSLSEDSLSQEYGAYIPRSYMGNSRLRIEGYRKLAEIIDEKELSELMTSWRDRYGQLPTPVHHLEQLNRIRLIASESGFTSVEVEAGKIILQKRGQYVTIGGKFPRLKARQPQKALEELLKVIKNLSGQPFSGKKRKQASS